MASPHAGENAGMDEQVLQLAEQLLETGFLKLSERERRVITGVAKRTQISRDVNRAFAEKQTLGDRLADRVASFGGSWTFIALCLAALIAWTAFNSVVRAWQVEPFDPYPYIFLNLILSMLAALQAPIILMSQNRQAARDRLAAGLDYEVNLKAEIEIIELHEKLDRRAGFNRHGFWLSTFNCALLFAGASWVSSWSCSRCVLNSSSRCSPRIRSSFSCSSMISISAFRLTS